MAFEVGPAASELHPPLTRVQYLIFPFLYSCVFGRFREHSGVRIFRKATLGSTKIADRILLMEDGKICELGTHAQLMVLNGKYARMYREQASWYAR